MNSLTLLENVLSEVEKEKKTLIRKIKKRRKEAIKKNIIGKSLDVLYALGNNGIKEPENFKFNWKPYLFEFFINGGCKVSLRNSGDYTDNQAFGIIYKGKKIFETSACYNYSFLDELDTSGCKTLLFKKNPPPYLSEIFSAQKSKTTAHLHIEKYSPGEWEEVLRELHEGKDVQEYFRREYEKQEQEKLIQTEIEIKNSKRFNLSLKKDWSFD